MNLDDIYNPNFNQKISIKDIPLLKEYLIKKSGWVYIAYSTDNNLLKIGRTGKNPLLRAKSLSSTGVLNDYKIFFALKVFNQYITEKKIHHKLKRFRITKKKEFFSVNKDFAINVMKNEYETEQKLLNRFFDTKIVAEDIELLEHAIIK